MISAKFDQEALNRTFASMHKQIRFAAAQALTKTAQDAQVEVQRQLPERFTIRTGWVAKGIRIIPATPDNLQSAVLVKDEFMTKQETGGEHTSLFGGSLAVPVGARPTPRSVTRPSQFPRALLAKPGYFIAPIKHGSRTMAVWKRTGNGRHTRLTLMYVFKQQVRLKPRFGFRDTVQMVADNRLQRRFDEALKNALATAR
ncbi:MAG: hypothetical protein HQM04_17915 [Magnetococcales bacterium]|nr:hypothetical protein [Magnetococcales bacterium]MBF0116905.1 hypothetical protein [Magnetococcales bacterium]